MVEKACRARISAQWGRPVEDHEWAAVRSGVEEKWMAEALAAVLPDHRKQVIEEAATAVERQDSRQFPGRGWDFPSAAALRNYPHADECGWRSARSDERRGGNEVGS